MHHYRQALLRMRQGDSDRDIAAAQVMGRPKAAQWRRIATELGWLDPARPLPDDPAIAAALGSPRKASTTISTLEPHRAQLGAWVEQGVSGTAIHAALPSWRLVAVALPMVSWAHCSACCTPFTCAAPPGWRASWTHRCWW